VEATCSNGPGGRVAGAVVNLERRLLTHLVAEPIQPAGAGKLVPMRVAEIAPGRVTLDCPTARVN
jgi:hypothetical protein